MQESLAIEIVRATWRLQRCARVESGLIDSVLETGLDPMQNEATAHIQLAVDRARTQSQNSIRRATADLRRLQTDCEVKTAVFADMKEPDWGLASVARVGTALVTQKRFRILDRQVKDRDGMAKMPATFHESRPTPNDGSGLCRSATTVRRWRRCYLSLNKANPAMSGLDRSIHLNQPSSPRENKSPCFIYPKETLRNRAEYPSKLDAAALLTSNWR